MAMIQMVLPKMGESVMEGTILSHLKQAGENIEEDEPILEVATDKVDTEIPSSHDGVLKEWLVKEGDVVQVGAPICVIDTEGDSAGDSQGDQQISQQASEAEPETISATAIEQDIEYIGQTVGQRQSPQEANIGGGSWKLDKPVPGRFYSPLVMNIAREEGIGMSELEYVPGSGSEGRVTKKDILDYLRSKQSAPVQPQEAAQQAAQQQYQQPQYQQPSQQQYQQPERQEPTFREEQRRDFYPNREEHGHPSQPAKSHGLPERQSYSPPQVPEKQTAGYATVQQQEAEMRQQAGAASLTNPPARQQSQASGTKAYSSQVFGYRKVQEGEETMRSQSTPEGNRILAPVVNTAPTIGKATEEQLKKYENEDEYEIIQMDRMRKMIAERMMQSVATSPHVASFVEADVTNMVYWRNKVKSAYKNKHGDAITFTPLFIEATAKALRDFPMVNVSVEGDKIIRKKRINIGMAVALPDNNLIVPVIRNADEMNIVGLTKKVNDFAKRARNRELQADDLQDGTFTISNIGSFGSVMGTPIINQPQVAIMALGTIQKKPAVVETPAGDAISIRHKCMMSLSYDHRVVDGALGSSFLRRVADYLESFDVGRDF